MTYSFAIGRARDIERGLFISLLGIPSPQIEETRQKDEFFGTFYRKEPEIQFHFPYYIFSRYCEKDQKRRRYTKIFLEKEAVFAAYVASFISRYKPPEFYQRYERAMFGNLYVSPYDPPYDVFSTKQFKIFLASLIDLPVLIPVRRDFDEILSEISEILLKAQTYGYSSFARSNHFQEVLDGWQGYEFVRKKFESDFQLLCNQFGGKPCL